MNAATLVRKLWNYCNVLRDDGMSDEGEQFGQFSGSLPALARKPGPLLLPQAYREWRRPRRRITRNG
jgi:hypothetical protein